MECKFSVFIMFNNPKSLLLTLLPSILIIKKHQSVVLKLNSFPTRKKEVQLFCFGNAPIYRFRFQYTNSYKQLRRFCIANNIRSTWMIMLKICAMSPENFRSLWKCGNLWNKKTCMQNGLPNSNFNSFSTVLFMKINKWWKH